MTDDDTWVVRSMDFAVLINTATRENPNAPRAAIITKPVTSIGRCGDIRMDTSATHEISKQHAQISYREWHGLDAWLIEDLRSLNSTLVNSTTIHQRVLKDGDEIVFGAGSSLMYGDVLLSTDSAECRYVFVIPDPALHFSARSNDSESLQPIEILEECCICYLPMVIRRRLPCGHTFCKGCVVRWRDRCHRLSRQFVCPVCRRICDSEDGKVPSLLYENGRWFVLNVEPCLRALDMLSVSEVMCLSIFERWNIQKKLSYWTAYEKVKEHPKKAQIFRWLTNSTYRALKDATEGELAIAMENLEGDTSLAGEQLREHVLWSLGSKLHDIEKSSGRKPWTCLPDTTDLSE
jgi:hypothetical protein